MLTICNFVFFPFLDVCCLLTALKNISSCTQPCICIETLFLLLAFQKVYLGSSIFSYSDTGRYIRSDSLNVYIFCTNRQWVGVVWLRGLWSSAGFLHNHKSISVLNLFRCYSSHLSVHSMFFPAPASFWMHYTKNVHPLSNSTPVRPDTLHWFFSIPVVLFTFPPLLVCWGGKTSC